ncbi:50S ribosomal protein L23 [Candidatus Cytomitobacter primus]|uniref:50S ribosomal protein L23 n=1 Tax=Candidatus Cytomitobacter primus TaxID=2066024 RepID=A0A5C0UG13_9PROT|nr:50S ribosomal protein L23 [Candidatus Cytomitobacter primus]QEK38739.1 50S ribosomal protein L23 [Candidatus Cytomitobacter primus]
MNQEIMLLSSIIKKFSGNIFSEKAIAMSKYGVLTLKFSKDISKSIIKSMCKNMLGVDVIDVNTCNVKSKSKFFKGVKGKKASFKKAFVRISKEDISKITEVAS